MSQQLTGSWIGELNIPEIPQLRVFMVYSADGSILATSSNNPALESHQHGAWVRIGDRQFSLVVLGFIFDAKGLAWRVVQRTSSGTQGVVAATGATAIVLGSFVIAAATVRYLRERAGEVTIVAMGQNAQEDADEDLLCARYLAAALRGDPLPATDVTLLGDDPAVGWADWFPRRDAELALEVDRFAFALPVHRENGLLIARAAQP